MPDLSFEQLTLYHWVALLFCSVLVGMSKTGVQGLGLLIVPVLAIALGGKTSAGLLAPMLAFADIFAVIYYSRHARWKYLLKLLPFTLAGIGLGVYVGDAISDEQFTSLIGVIIIVSVAILLWRERKRVAEAPAGWAFSAVAGLAGGFATMIGNAAGPVMAVYLLSMRMPKNTFIGTGAWFFLIVNIVKIPFHIIFWETISWDSLKINAAMAPCIILGAYVGLVVVKKIPEKPYRIFVIATTVLAAIRLFL